MKMSIGDIIDRYSICKLKKERLAINNDAELSALKKEIDPYRDLDSFVDRMYDINGKIWDLESDIRKGKEGELGLEEVGRRAIQIREYNSIRVDIKNQINFLLNEGYQEVKGDHASEKNIPVYVSLTTVPKRLVNPMEHGLKAVLISLCEQDYKSYEVHFNVPLKYNVTGEDYVLPEWLDELQSTYNHLKVYRTEDFGPPTKFYPTLKRVEDLESLLIVVDDDLIYDHRMVSEHVKYQKLLGDVAICYDGRGTPEPEFNDLRDSWVLCVTKPKRTDVLQHYKSASYKKKYFGPDLEDKYLGRTLSDDVLISTYFKHHSIPIYVVPFEEENHLYDTFEKWQVNNGVTSFPVIKHAGTVDHTGCSDPEMLAIQPRFYEPHNLGL